MQIEKTRNVRLYVNFDVQIEVEKIENDLNKVWIFCANEDRICDYWNNAQVEAMINDGFRQVDL